MRGLAPLVIVALAAPSVHAAEPEQKRARALNAEGMKKYDLGDYDDAIGLFKRAYETFADPKILFNLAQAQRKKGDLAAALDSYRTYLRRLPGAPNRGVVEERIAELERALAPPPAPAPPPGAGEAAASVEPSPPVPAGLDAAPGSPVEPWYRDGWGWALAGGGLLAVGVGGGLLVHAASLDGDLASAPEAERAAIRDDITRDRVLGGIALAAGGALLVAGIVKLAATPAPPAARSVSVGPGWIVLRGTF